MKLFLLKTFLFTLFAFSANIYNANAQTQIKAAPKSPKWQWFKGNTHTHTKLCGHADSAPEQVVKWYHDQGYNFLVLSEHNRLIHPASVSLPGKSRKDFILIPGEEVTNGAPHHVHSTAVNIQKVVFPVKNSKNYSKRKVVEGHIERTRAQRGLSIINHPYYRNALNFETLNNIPGLRHFELFNGHHDTAQDTYNKDKNTEVLWDSLLTEGAILYGIALDDAHAFKTWDTNRSSPSHSNPGRGWIMVKAKELSPLEITKSIMRGDFYSSNGVVLKTYSQEGSIYRIAVDKEETFKTLNNRYKGKEIVTGRHSSDEEEGVLIEFIGANGEILKSVRGVQGEYSYAELPYVRARVKFTRYEKEKKQKVTYYAWGQPAFGDQRSLERLKYFSSDELIKKSAHK